ncbi:MAG: hypothetical protein KF739_04660 [Cryobacterium sp.]|nr:hypothetical protein [Cryobacterium sp.]
MFDFDALTLGEVSKIEELSGQSIASIADADSPKGKALAAMAMVVKRRTGDPAFTWNQACALTLDEANQILGLNEEEQDEPELDPTSEDYEDEAGKEQRSSGSEQRETSAAKAKK